MRRSEPLLGASWQHELLVARAYPLASRIPAVPISVGVKAADVPGDASKPVDRLARRSSPQSSACCISWLAASVAAFRLEEPFCECRVHRPARGARQRGYLFRPRHSDLVANVVP